MVGVYLVMHGGLIQPPGSMVHSKTPMKWARHPQAELEESRAPHCLEHRPATGEGTPPCHILASLSPWGHPIVPYVFMSGPPAMISSVYVVVTPHGDISCCCMHAGRSKLKSLHVQKLIDVNCLHYTMCYLTTSINITLAKICVATIAVITSSTGSPSRR